MSGSGTGARVQMRRDVIVLCFHAISEQWPAGLSLPPETFSAQLRLLLGRGYRGATFTQAIHDPPFPRTVAITFDDAYRSVLEYGLPLLSEIRWPATLFVPTAFIGTGRPMSWPGIEQWLGGPHEKELHPLCWDEVRMLADAGWEIGSHTCTHPRLPDVDDETLVVELTASRARCEEELGRPCRSLAYPYGDVGTRERLAAMAAGYRAAGTLPRRFDSEQPLAWPRVGVWRADSRLTFRLKVSPFVRGLRTTRVWPLLDKARVHYGPAKSALRRVARTRREP